MIANVRQSATFSLPRQIWQVIKNQAQDLSEGAQAKTAKPKQQLMIESYSKLLESQVELMVGKYSDL